MKHLFLVLMLIGAACYSQCTYTASNPFPSSLVVGRGQTLCVSGDHSTSFTSISVQSGGVIRVYNGSIFRVNGSLAVFGTGKIMIEDCDSKLEVNGTYRGVYRNCEISIFCDDCASNRNRFFQLIWGVQVWRNMCCEAALPVELISFKVKSQDCIDYLSWTTGSEINNDHFLVEQSSNGVEWKEVGLVGGSGNTLEPTTYSFTTSSVNEVNYYRLKQVDFDGGYEYSETVISNCNVNKSPVIREFNILGQDVKLSTKGIVFLLYEDGKVEKVYRK